jgi:F0F1-type ATP synthase assembly protein I
VSTGAAGELQDDERSTNIVKEITTTTRGRVRGTYHQELGRAVAVEANTGGFFASILAGFLLGLGLDAWIGTSPAFTIVGIILGSVTGFMKMWQIAKRG